MLDWLFTTDPGAAARRNAYPTQYREYQGPSPRAPSDPGAAARRNAYPTQYREPDSGSQEPYYEYEEDPQAQLFQQQQRRQPSYGGGEVHIQRKHGRFYVQAMIADVAFMAVIDTGASTCKITHKVMHDLGVDLRGIRWNGIYDTANGPVRAITVPLDITVMGIERQGIACGIMEYESGHNLIGMSFISTLSRCDPRGNTLIMAA